MYVEVHNTWNPKAIERFKAGDRLGDAFSKTEETLRYIDEISPLVRAAIVKALLKRLSDVVGDYSFHTSLMPEDILRTLVIQKEHPELIHAIYQFTCKMLQIPPKKKTADADIEVFSLDNAKAHERLSYYFVKSMVDVLGEKGGVELWKDVVGLRLRDQKIAYEKAVKEKLAAGGTLSTLVETNQQAMDRWDCIGIGNYVYVRLDEHKVLFRFDRCHTHEALRDLNDPYISYLCSCYIGDHPNYNFGRQYLRRTQTLHHGSFCDELYWMREFHDNPEQPSLAFTRSIHSKADLQR